MSSDGVDRRGVENKLIQLNLGLSLPIFCRSAQRGDFRLLVSRETRRRDLGLKTSQEAPQRTLPTDLSVDLATQRLSITNRVIHSLIHCDIHRSIHRPVSLFVTLQAQRWFPTRSVANTTTANRKLLRCVLFLIHLARPHRQASSSVGGGRRVQGETSNSESQRCAAPLQTCVAP